MTLRGSYAEGFIAPTVFNLFGAPQGSVPDITVQGVSAQEQINLISNPNLEAAKSQSYGGGIVFSPKGVEGLTLNVDYYNIKTENDVYRLDATAMVTDLNASGSDSIYAPFYRFDDGSQLTSNAPNQVDHANWGILAVPLANGAEVETDGIDVGASYRLETESAGTFMFMANANVLFNYTVYDPVSGGPYHYDGEYTDGGAANAQGSMPDFVLTMAAIWDYKDLSFTVNAKYIPEMDDLGNLHPSQGAPSNDFTLDGEAWDIPSYYTIDMQVAYEFGKTREDKRWYDGTRFAVGVNNLTDEMPPLIASAFEDNTDKSTYDILGRFIYFEVSKKY